MATEHAVDLGPDRVITDLDAEPESVQAVFRTLIAQTPVALGDENEENETYFLPE